MSSRVKGKASKAPAKATRSKISRSVDTNVSSYDRTDPFTALNVLRKLIASLSTRLGGCQYKMTPEEHKLSMHLLTIIEPFVGHSGTVESVGYFPGGNRFASGSSDGSIRIWTIPKGEVDWHMKEDGWIVGRDEELLIWIPSDLRYSIIMPTCPLTINCSFETKLDFSGHFEGRSWTSNIPSV